MGYGQNLIYRVHIIKEAILEIESPLVELLCASATVGQPILTHFYSLYRITSDCYIYVNAFLLITVIKVFYKIKNNCTTTWADWAAGVSLAFCWVSTVQQYE